MFSEQQEEWLGEIMDQGIRTDFNTIEDPEGYLQKLGERILKQLPATKIQYKFVIVDSPELNSFGVAGGRIYIHRRMIGFARNEDELAGLLGHEIGHIADHHAAIDITRWLKQLGVTSVGDKEDVFAKWNLFTDNVGKIKERHIAAREQEEQLIADRIGIYAATRAGYDPERYVDFADRLFETKHNTGTFWSDFFGATTSASKRLRELVKNAEPLAKTCIAPRQADADHYAAWQKKILESRRVAVKEEVPGILQKVKLQPELRTDLGHLEFSLDGKYLLAQDESSIFVLSRDPFAFLFRIDALDAHSAHFSSDSHSVTFYDKEMRVEAWDVAAKKRTTIYQVSIPECFQSALSPNGDFLGCLDQELNLRIVDVAKNEQIYLQKDFYRLTWREYEPYLLALTGAQPFRLLDMKFSPDGRYFAAGRHRTAFAYDVKARSEVHLPVKTQDLMQFTFAFTGPNEFAGMEFSGNTTLKLVRARFPSGDHIGDFKFQAEGWLASTQSPNYLLLRPAGAYPVAIIDLKAEKIALAFKTPAFAVYGQTFAGEQNSGEIALLNAGDNKLSGRLQLPESPLAGDTVSSFSPDGKWLGVSGKSRGAFWKLDSGERVFFTRAFEGAYFKDNQIISKFPVHSPDPSRVFQFDTATKAAAKLYDVSEDPKKKNQAVIQADNFVVTVRPEKDQQPIEGPMELSDYFHQMWETHSTIEVRDVTSNKVLWEKVIQERRPQVFYSNGAISLIRSMHSGVRKAAKDDSSLKNRLGTGDDKQDQIVVQVFDAATGNLRGSVVVDSGKFSFSISSAYAAGNTLFAGDSRNRTIVYSLQTGQQKGKLIGRVVAISPGGDRILVENGDGFADLIDVATLKPRTHYGFPPRIAYADFLSDNSLMVLTSDQTVYHVKPDGNVQAASAK